ncbi:CHAD domain-containing protein [Ancylobacter sp.]|uniref:CHAD domain-containing protein n=1 Tax=Ancylobacter sp. TaxID=1872567 RepID=UPI003D130899
MPHDHSEGSGEAVDSVRAGDSPPPRRLSEALQHAHAEAAAALALGDPVQAVHDLRKGFKRLRALLRLAGAARNRTLSRRARATRNALSATARELSQARDGAAREDALDDLVAKAGLSSAARRAAAKALSAGAATTGEAGLGEHRAALEALLATLATDLPQLGAALDDKALIAALAGDYARARRAGRAVDPANEESLHELRKTVIAQRYQMELVSPAWPALGELWVDELQRLRDKLGKHQDLAVLRALVEAHPLRAGRPPLWLAALLDALAARQEKLAGSALRLQARLFAEKPKAFRQRLSAYMSALSDGK